MKIYITILYGTMDTLFTAHTKHESNEFLYIIIRVLGTCIIAYPNTKYYTIKIL